jgi:hypothetical protein
MPSSSVYVELYVEVPVAPPPVVTYAGLVVDPPTTIVLTPDPAS